MVFLDQLESYRVMTLAKIPFILLGTWGVNASYTRPNPPPPQRERFSSSVPLENSGLVEWGPIVGKVSNYSYFSRKILTKVPSDRPYNLLLALLRYQLS